MTMQIATCEYQEPALGFIRFWEASHYKDMPYFSWDLTNYGFNHLSDFEPALQRALMACVKQKMPIRDHFQPVFIDRQGHLIKCWKLSKIALKLVIINADTNNPMVSQAQFQMIDRKSP